ncbi:MAG TPA: hypothetical protein VFW83_02005 [Bryobacteraceae bacterium]|nr:hypothetical protein [Bryobacteraceae bacterium]
MPALEEAAQHLRSLPREQAAAPRLREEFENLSADLRACQALIAHGLGFIHRWAGFLAASYTPGGEPAPLTAQGNVSVEG